jgi:hypothetical protein
LTSAIGAGSIALAGISTALAGSGLEFGAAAGATDEQQAPMQRVKFFTLKKESFFFVLKLGQRNIKNPSGKQGGRHWVPLVFFVQPSRHVFVPRKFLMAFLNPTRGLRSAWELEIPKKNQVKKNDGGWVLFGCIRYMCMNAGVY